MNFTWKTQIRKNHETAHKSIILSERLHEKKREPQSLCIYNGMHTFLLYMLILMTAHLFLERELGLQVMKYQTALNTCSPSFTRCEAFRSDCFFAMHLLDVTLCCHFRVLVWVDVLEYSSGMIPSCYSRARLRHFPQSETPNSPNHFTGVLSHSLRDLQGDSSKIFWFEGSAPCLQNGAPRPLPTPTT